MDTNITQREPRRDFGFAFGLMAGTVVGAGLALWFLPRATALRRQVTDTSTDLADKGRGLLDKGRDLRDDAATVVARGAHEVERYAKSVRS